MGEPRPRARWADRAGEPGLVVTGVRWSLDQPADLLRVYPTGLVDPASEFELPPMAGRTEVDPGGIRFVPRFGFSPGASYRVLVRSGTGPPRRFTLTRPSDSGRSTTRVEEVYPTARCLPFNQLRLYVCFSAPMSEGGAERRVRVLDDDSDEVLSDALLPMEPELWDRDRRRLTVLFDPGRIKQGLRPNLEAGYPLAAGRAVRLVVDAELKDARGRPMVESFERRYDVGPDLRAHVSPAAWTLSHPTAGTRTPLVVRFDRPLDYALLLRCLSVHAGAEPGGTPLKGVVAVGHEERSWAFVPRVAWPVGEHHLEVAPTLEDHAGNSVTRVFDRDLLHAAHDPRPSSPVVLPFAVHRSASAGNAALEA